MILYVYIKLVRLCADLSIPCVFKLRSTYFDNLCYVILLNILDSLPYKVVINLIRL